MRYYNVSSSVHSRNSRRDDGGIPDLPPSTRNYSGLRRTKETEITHSNHKINLEKIANSSNRFSLSLSRDRVTDYWDGVIHRNHDTWDGEVIIEPKKYYVSEKIEPNTELTKKLIEMEKKRYRLFDQWPMEILQTLRVKKYVNFPSDAIPDGAYLTYNRDTNEIHVGGVGWYPLEKGGTGSKGAPLGTGDMNLIFRSQFKQKYHNVPKYTKNVFAKLGEFITLKEKVATPKKIQNYLKDLLSRRGDGNSLVSYLTVSGEAPKCIKVIRKGPFYGENYPSLYPITMTFTEKDWIGKKCQITRGYLSESFYEYDTSRRLTNNCGRSLGEVMNEIVNELNTKIENWNK
ncbi:MAG: hypothetical protein KJ646_02230 [Nanoarchaeota archaeon]|nr:hypothetical protein [Nanoarchaeota archaeon]